MNVLCECMYVLQSLCLVPIEDIGFPEPGLMHDGGLQWGFLKMNLGPLQDQQELLTWAVTLALQW